MLALFFSIHAHAQTGKNYILEVNGDTVSLSLDEATILKTKDGRSLNIRLKQKEVMTYSDETITFQYPGNLTVSKKQIDNIEQVLCISGSGNGFIIQKYKSVNPENMVDLMLDEITGESKDAGYKETKVNVEKRLGSGQFAAGKKSTLVLDDETDIFAVYATKIKKGGILIVEMMVTPDDKKDMEIFEMLWKTLEIKN